MARPKKTPEIPTVKLTKAKGGTVVKKTEKTVIDKVEGEGFYRIEGDVKDFADWPLLMQEEFESLKGNLHVGWQSNKVRYVDLRPEPPVPSEFLTSKGFQQVHEGQRINATFEEIHQLLKEYREL